MTMILFNAVCMLMIVLVIFAARNCDKEIKLRKSAFVVLFCWICLGHYALCRVDSPGVYDNWITLLFICILIRFFWKTHQAKHNNYKMRITILNVVLLSVFTCSYIIIGLLSMRYANSISSG